MKRWILAAAAIIAAALPVGDLALARDGDRGSWAQQRDRGRGDERARGRSHDPRSDDRRGAGRRDRGPRGEDDRRRGDWDRPPPYYAPPPVYSTPYPRPRGPLIRPGGYLPPAYRGALLYDYQRYRLRPPPHGYAWFRVGGSFLLVSLADGQIFDVAQ
jgi:Ni/Co efflux regulator RcnB